MKTIEALNRQSVVFTSSDLQLLLLSEATRVLDLKHEDGYNRTSVQFQIEHNQIIGVKVEFKKENA